MFSFLLDEERVNTLYSFLGKCPVTVPSSFTAIAHRSCTLWGSLSQASVSPVCQCASHIPWIHNRHEYSKLFQPPPCMYSSVFQLTTARSIFSTYWHLCWWHECTRHARVNCYRYIILVNNIFVAKIFSYALSISTKTFQHKNFSHKNF